MALRDPDCVFKNLNDALSKPERAMSTLEGLGWEYENGEWLPPVHEAQGAEEEEEDSFEGLVYVAPEEGQDWWKYFSLSRKSCSEAQWNYVLENCPICKGTDGSNDYLQICNDGEGWFDNDDLTSKDIVVSFNDLFQNPKEK